MNSLGFPRGVVLTPAEEKRIAKELSTPVAWPTLVLAVVLPAAHWTVVGFGLARILPLWACALILTFTSYAHYTPVHESIHGNLAPGSSAAALAQPAGRLGRPALGLAFNLADDAADRACITPIPHTDEDPGYLS